jgi:gliding motility-associated-like protein
MLKHYKYLLLAIAAIFNLTSLWSQADTLCVSSTVGNYHVVGWAGSTFEWSTQGNGQILSGQGNDSVTVAWNSIEGTYLLQVTEISAEGCVGPPQAINIVLIAPSIILLNQPLCAPDLQSYSISVSVNGGSLSSNAGNIDSISLNSYLVSGIPTATNVQLILTNNGCSDTLNVVAPACPCPTIQPPLIAPSVSICRGANIPVLNATVPDGVLVNWYADSNGLLLLAADTAQFLPDSIGIYYLEAVDTLSGCVSLTKSSVTLNEIPPIVAEISGDTVICLQTSTILQASGGSTYLWSTSDTTASIEVTPQENATYSVIVNAGICPDTAEVLVSVLPLPDLIISNDTTIEFGDTAAINVFGANTYAWSPANDLSCYNCFNPDAYPKQTTTYCVVGSSQNGCTDTACVEVKVEIICDELFVPTAFAPGNEGDPENECLKLYGTNCVKVLDFKIYNRWGEVVFSTTNIRDCWDGLYKGEEVNSEAFVYSLQVELITGEKINRKGNITLIK